MKPKLSKAEEKKLYILGWGIILICLLLLFMSRQGLLTGPLFTLPCLFHYLTGFYCPGCGGTRAVKALLEGGIIRSFFLHPVVPYTAAIFVWYMISHSAEYLTKGKLHMGLRFREAYLYGAIGIILFQWVIRNLLKLIWGIDVL